MIKSPKSNAEIQIEEAIDHMKVMISKQCVKLPDAEYLVNQAYKVLYKCEELRISRDNHRQKRIIVEQKLKELQNNGKKN